MAKVNIFPILFVLLAAFLFVSCENNKVNKETILIDEKAKLIDVRTKEEFRQGHLKGALNIPYTEIEKKIQEHVKDKEEKIILYCRSGRRAEIAKKTLDEMGYKNVINAGGYESLKKEKP